MEIRHSSILAWLLDPRETHGLSDKFLRAFLCEALRDQPSFHGPTALDVAQADLRDAEVRREWQNIDVFILLPQLKWAFIVENKFHSSQHEGQLRTYAERVKSIFEPQEGLLKIRGVFLTLYNENPQDESYAPLNYHTVASVLSDLIADSLGTIQSEVNIFIRHYIEIIEEAAGMNDERKQMEALARQLYRSHKKVLDFILDHGVSTDFALAVDATFGDGLYEGDQFQLEGQNFYFHAHGNHNVSFLPSSWTDALGDQLHWKGCEKWWAGFPLICWIQLYAEPESASGRLLLYAEVGPISDHAFRSRLIAAIKEAAEANDERKISFQRNAADPGKKYSKFLKGNEVDVRDIQNIEEIEKAIKTLLRQFYPVFKIVADLLPEFTEYGYIPES